jgi:heat-inducible transcriptional repressor
MVKDDRKEHVLLDIVQDYIRTAQPVSSGGLLAAHTYDLSSATLRNVMAELDEAGFLEQPHTSAGRVPTAKAYQFFVDKVALGSREPVREGEAHKRMQLPPSVRRQLQTALAEDTQDAARAMSRYLAQATNAMAFAGIVGMNQFYREGLQRLLEEPEFLNADNIRQLVAFADSLEEQMAELYEQAADEVRIYAGVDERGRRATPFSVMTFGSQLPGNEQGIFGIVGPMRMRYADNLRLLENIRDIFD